jgi:hypothetical protein
MAYELRVNGRILDRYDRPEDALNCVRALMRLDCDLEPEVLDLRTGRPVVPAASMCSREELATKIGF